MLLSYRPVFIGWIAFVCQLPLQIFLTIWVGGFFGGILKGTGLFEKDDITPLFIMGLLAFVAVPLIAYFGKKLNYNRTLYKLYDDRIEFEEGFLTIGKKVIKFKDVKEVDLRRGILQRSCGLGSIYLATAATGGANARSGFSAFGMSSVSSSGVVIKDITDAEDAYEKVRALIDAKTDA